MLSFSISPTTSSTAVALTLPAVLRVQNIQPLTLVAVSYWFADYFGRNACTAASLLS